MHEPRIVTLQLNMIKKTKLLVQLHIFFIISHIELNIE